MCLTGYFSNFFVCVKQVELSELERSTGMLIHPQLNRKTTKNLCSNDGCKLRSRDTTELYYLQRKLGNARSIEQLDNHVNNFKVKFPDISLDENVLKTYEEQRNAFSNREKRAVEL